MSVVGLKMVANFRIGTGLVFFEAFDEVSTGLTDVKGPTRAINTIDDITTCCMTLWIFKVKLLFQFVGGVNESKFGVGDMFFDVVVQFFFYVMGNTTQVRKFKRNKSGWFGLGWKRSGGKLFVQKLSDTFVYETGRILVLHKVLLD